MTAHAQLPLNFEPGLTTRHRTLEDCCAAVVHNSRIGLDGVASHIDMAPSELSRRLNAHLPAREGESNNRPLRISDFVGIVDATQDYRPIYWLVERFLRDPEVVKTQALHQLVAFVPMLQSLIEQAGLTARAKR